MPESELREENKVKGKGGDGKGPDFPIKILLGKQMGEEQKGLTLLPSSAHSGRGPAAPRVSWERPSPIIAKANGGQVLCPGIYTTGARWVEGKQKGK